jgi:hypothetical protein
LPGVTSTTKPSTSSSTNVPSPTSGPPASGGGTQGPGP